MLAKLNHKQSRKRKLYEEIKRFQHEEDYQKWMTASTDLWTLNNQNNGLKYETQYFYCRFSRRDGNFCTASIKIKKHYGEIIVEQSGEHEHEIFSAKFTSQQKEFIRKKMIEKYNSKQIQKQFLMQFGNFPNLIQIRNFMAYENSKNQSKRQINGQLKTNTEQDGQIPIDINAQQGQKSQQPLRINLDKSNRQSDSFGRYGIVSIGNDGKPSNSGQINELPVKTVLKTCFKNELSEADNDGQQKPRERLIVHQYNPLFLLPPKLREPDSLIYCKVCGRVYQIFEALRHHLFFYHQVKPSELEKWYERYPLSNPNKAAPDPSLQPRRGRPPKYTIYQQNDGKLMQRPPSTYMSREQKAQRNKMLYERVICSLCQKDLFEDCMREHLKRVHGILSCTSDIANYIGMRIRPMMKEEKMNDGYEELEGDGGTGVERNEETNSSKCKIAAAAKKDEISHIRLVVCAVCRKALRRDSLREHLRTKHNIETAGLKEAKEHIYDELDWKKSSEEKHRRYDSLQTIKQMYEDSLRDESGRIYCMLCDEAVFPGTLRSHLNIMHGISMASLMTKDAVTKYSIKVKNIGQMGEEMQKLMEVEEPMIIKNEFMDEEEEEQQQVTNDLSMPSTSKSVYLDNSPTKSLNSIEVKEEMPSDNEEE